MELQVILFSFLLNGVIAVFLKSSLEGIFTKKIVELQHNHSIELSQLNAELQKLNSRDTTRFADLHQRRAIVILDLYRLLVKAEEAISRGLLPRPWFIDQSSELSPWERARETTNYVYKAISDVADFYILNQILFSSKQKDLLDHIVKVIKFIHHEILMTELQKEAPPEDHEEMKDIEARVKQRLEDAKSQFFDYYPSVKSELENDFRNTLGFEIGS